MSLEHFKEKKINDVSLWKNEFWIETKCNWIIECINIRFCNSSLWNSISQLVKATDSKLVLKTRSESTILSAVHLTSTYYSHSFCLSAVCTVC